MTISCSASLDQLEFPDHQEKMDQNSQYTSLKIIHIDPTITIYYFDFDIHICINWYSIGLSQNKSIYFPYLDYFGSIGISQKYNLATYCPCEFSDIQGQRSLRRSMWRPDIGGIWSIWLGPSEHLLVPRNRRFRWRFLLVSCLFWDFL